MLSKNYEMISTLVELYDSIVGGDHGELSLERREGVSRLRRGVLEWIR